MVCWNNINHFLLHKRYNSRPMCAYSYLENNIGAEGANTLTESLKQNVALTELNLEYVKTA